MNTFTSAIGCRPTGWLLVAAAGLLVVASCGGAGDSGGEAWRFDGSDAGGDSPDVGVSEEVEIRSLDDSQKLAVCEALGEHVLERASKERYCQWRAQSPESELAGAGLPEDDEAARTRCEEAKQHCDEQVAVYPDNPCSQLNQLVEECSATVGEWKRCVVEYTRIGVEQMNRARSCDEVTAEHYAEAADGPSCERPEACADLHRKCSRLSSLYGDGMVEFSGCSYPDDSGLSP